MHNKIQLQYIENDIKALIESLSHNIFKELKHRNPCCPIPQRKRIIEINNIEELRSYLSACRVVFLLVYTTYCPYCRMFKPVFYEVAKQYNEYALFASVNADYVPEIALEYEVLTAPITLVFINGRLADALIGYIPPQYLKEYIEHVLYRTKCIEMMKGRSH